MFQNVISQIAEQFSR